MLRRIIILFFLVLPLVGCATAPQKGPRFTGVAEMKPGFSLLYIYRPYHFNGSIGWPTVFLNGVKTVDLVNQSYTFVHIRAGRYAIRTKISTPLSPMGNVPGEISIKPHKVYFLHFDITYFSREGSKIKLGKWTLTGKDDAVSEMRRLRYVRPYVETIGVDRQP